MRYPLVTLLWGVLATSLPSGSEAATHHVNQAREILGKQFKKSPARTAENVDNLVPFVRETFEKRLPKYAKKHSARLTETLIALSEEFGMDPLFPLAVISQESSFNPRTIGPVGEIGLMQLRPTTATWLAKKFSIPYKGKKTLTDPVVNIQFGIRFLSLLREQFDSNGKLYISAYNMGASNVRRAMKKQIQPKEYASRVIKRYLMLYRGLNVHYSERQVMARLLDQSSPSDQTALQPLAKVGGVEHLSAAVEAINRRKL